MSDCYYDASGCLVCPEQASQAYVPGGLQHRAVLGWSASANSIDVHDGDLHIATDMPLGVIGTILGLQGERTLSITPSLIEHGWYFHKEGGFDLAQPIERGALVGSPITARTATTLFEVRRVADRITYWKDGVQTYSSLQPSAGEKMVKCCLYASGDTAPSSAGGGGGGGIAPLAIFTELSTSFDVFLADCSKENGSSIVSRNWDLGDGSTATGSNPTHTYAAVGTYAVALTVVNSEGLSNTRTSAAVINGLANNGNNGPIASGAPKTINTPGGNASYTKDPYWAITVPTGATKLEVTLVPDSAGVWVARGGWLIVNFGTPIGSGDSAPTDGGIAETSPYTVVVNNPTPGKYFMALDIDNAATGMVLTATVT